MKRIPTYDEYIDSVNEAAYAEFIVDFVNEAATSKDIMRINDIVKKSDGNESKAVQLATTMATLIKNKQKAIQRYEAALEILGEDHPVTEVFANKAISLGHNIEKVKKEEKEKKDKTRGKLGSEDSSFKKEGRTPYMYRGGAPILPIGSTNLATGKCKYFNIYDTWGKANETTIELYQDMDSGSYKMVFTSGDGPITRIGEKVPFVHDQTGRHLFYGHCLDWCNIGDASLLMRKYNIKSASGYVYK